MAICSRTCFLIVFCMTRFHFSSAILFKFDRNCHFSDIQLRCDGKTYGLMDGHLKRCENASKKVSLCYCCIFPGIEYRLQTSVVPINPHLLVSDSDSVTYLGSTEYVRLWFRPTLPPSVHRFAIPFLRSFVDE